jgi:hypothetical protein
LIPSKPLWRNWATSRCTLHTPEGQKQIAKALSGKSNLVAAKSARIVGEALWSELINDLVAAFDRFIARGAAGDKGGRRRQRLRRDHRRGARTL